MTSKAKPDPKPEVKLDPQLDPENPGSPAWFLAQVKSTMSPGGTVSQREWEERWWVEAYEAGLNRHIPAQWSLKFGHLLDPEYPEYLRLRAKFDVDS